MIELTILELLYLVLTFFIVIIGTLITMSLIRLLKILAVGVEIANYYWQMKQLLVYYSQVPFILKEKIFEYFAQGREDEYEEEMQETQGSTEK